MMRVVKWSLAATALSAMALAGGAQAADDDGDLKALLADCGNPNIERSDIDSCLERARDIAETAPSPLLQGLTARLERRAEALDEGSTVPAAPETQVAGTPPVAGGGASSVAAADSAEKAAPH